MSWSESASKYWARSLRKGLLDALKPKTLSSPELDSADMSVGDDDEAVGSGALLVGVARLCSSRLHIRDSSNLPALAALVARAVSSQMVMLGRFSSSFPK